MGCDRTIRGRPARASAGWPEANVSQVQIPCNLLYSQNIGSTVKVVLWQRRKSAEELDNLRSVHPN